MFEDLVKETTTTTGTGSLTLAGAATGYRTFASAFPTGARVSYAILSATEREVGVGRLTGSTTLTRNEVLYSTNANALVNFSAGSKDVICSVSADMLLAMWGAARFSVRHLR
jgi:hypothetical protein